MGHICTILTFNASSVYNKSKKSSKNDLINEYEVFFFKNSNRVWRKMSEYEGKKIGLSKRAYSFNRYLRVLDLAVSSKIKAKLSKNKTNWRYLR